MNKKLTVLVAMIMLSGMLITGCVEMPTEEPEVLILATTTSLYDTGLLVHLEPIFEDKHNVDLQIISAGTGIAIRHGEDGDVDVLLVHDRAREDAFVEAGYGVNRRCIAYNYFLIIGSKDDPAGIRGMSPEDAVTRIMEAGIKDPQIRFVSRGDDSGTHAREIAIWVSAGHDYEMVRMSGPWYVEAGAGMGATLRMANEKSAYTLVDIGTFLAFAGDVDLVPLVEVGELLFNPYGVIAVNPELHPHVNFEMANNFINFLMSPEIQQKIGEFGVVDGRPLFFPLASDCQRKGCPTWELCKTSAS
ncbi:MAG: substrate-binding domain-containing protein [Methanosarcinales archaeon Met12]|nr:MAG: substrate-binding domain-containing protein [Methanosarcinales archaeon Met12]